MTEETDIVRRGANLLKGGAVMMADMCPACGTPLFKIGDEIKCVKCNKQVVIVTGVEDETRRLKTKILEDTEQTLLNKVNNIQAAIQKENDPEKLQRLVESLTGILNALEKLRHD
jgi:uncharacterized Zn finger protein (UPF0148 family)